MSEDLFVKVVRDFRERAFDLGNKGNVAELADALENVLADNRATIEPDWRPIGKAPTDLGTTAYLFFPEGSESFRIKSGSMISAILFAKNEHGSFWSGLLKPYLIFDEHGKASIARVSPWNMNPTTEEMIEMGALFRPMPAPPRF